MKKYKIEIDANWEDTIFYASVYVGKYRAELRHKSDGCWPLSFPTRRAARKAAKDFVKQLKEAEEGE